MQSQTAVADIPPCPVGKRHKLHGGTVTVIGKKVLNPHALRKVIVNPNHQIVHFLPKPQVIPADAVAELNRVIAVALSDFVKTVTEIPNINIVPVAAFDNIIPATAANRVISVSAFDHIRSVAAGQNVIAVGTVNRLRHAVRILSYLIDLHHPTAAVGKFQLINRPVAVKVIVELQSLPVISFNIHQQVGTAANIA